MANGEVAGDDELAREIAQLKAEIGNLKAALAERADDIVQGASRAAEVVTQPIRNNPGTAGMLFGALVGLAAGIAIAQATRDEPRHWYDRYR
ncbi:MAG: hypothetical protein JNK47_19920 [Mesorhizobium sp.]|nr:hypothetical protein [Mesorhizobium sp.]MBL8579477.1 hypothetical protein [Mesorhizobium sp.]